MINIKEITDLSKTTHDGLDFVIVWKRGAKAENHGKTSRSKCSGTSVQVMM